VSEHGYGLVDRAVGYDRAAPDVSEQLLACNDPVAIGNEKDEKIEDERLQLEDPAVSVYLETKQVDLQRRNLTPHAGQTDLTRQGRCVVSAYVSYDDRCRHGATSLSGKSRCRASLSILVPATARATPRIRTAEPFFRSLQP
jgi:hypothetical protein